MNNVCIASECNQDVYNEQDYYWQYWVSLKHFVHFCELVIMVQELTLALAPQELCREWDNKPPEQKQFDPFYRVVSAVANSSGTKFKTRVMMVNRVSGNRRHPLLMTPHLITPVDAFNVVLNVRVPARTFLFHLMLHSYGLQVYCLPKCV